MECFEAVDFLFDLRRFRVRPGTDALRGLLRELGDPHEDVRCVQIAGSNGKGSTARMVESILREAGYRVGLYTSPHFDDVRERIRVDGRKISEAALTEFVETVRPSLVERAANGTPITFFEAVTAMGLWQFARADVDVAVLEVGLGGEFDATSVVSPEAAAVTNVTLEHTDVLGDTLDEIAATKAAVAPAGAPLVTAATGESLDAVRRVTDDVRTVDTDADADVVVSYEGRTAHDEGGVTLAGDGWRVETAVPMLGAYQARNAGVAAALAGQIGDVADGDVARGLRNAHWPGRFEIVERDPLVVLDGAHNPSACEAVAETLSTFDYDDLHLVFGAMHDKDHRGMVDALPEAAAVVTCAPDLERAEDPAVLAAAFEDAGASTVRVGDAVVDALDAAREGAGPDDCVLVVGSLFGVAEARTTWTRAVVPKRVESTDAARDVLSAAHATGRDVREAVDESVHGVVRTRVERRQARVLERAMARAGGTCVVSGHRSDGELLNVVLSGTRAQFRALLDDVSDRGLGLSSVAADVRSQVGLDAPARSRGYPWEDHPCVMGILNVTPDSFHDGGEFFDAAAAVERAREMAAAGAAIVDVGGESTRPGATPVDTATEIDRVVPVVEELSDLDVTVSVDTRKAAVGRAALDAGADVLNDVTGLADPEMRYVAADHDVPLVVMHSIDAPVVPDKDVEYDDVVEDIVDELRERVFLAEKAGLSRDQILVDPGIGFGKSTRENFELLGRVSEFEALGCPLLVGHSHKSMFEHVGRGSGDRRAATVAGSTVAVERGADVVRVHDVPENVAAVRTAIAAADPDAGPWNDEA
ncbi:dihydropteroate synthase [Salinirarus marinus]|uniref:dihydropteroate synthase n=1 Tax=Salinirarus marinus TaxID=3068310 RepID=UPI003C6CA807